MKRAALILAAAVLLLAGAAGGYWLGFRDAWYLGIAANSVPRGVVATHQLRYLKTGRPSVVATNLEFDVDQGLLRGDDVLGHPLHGLLAPLWGLDVQSRFEKSLPQLAAYRKLNASLLDPGAFDRNKDLMQDARETKERLDRLVERYGKAAP